MIAYTGIETVSNMAEEARDPGRDVPRTVNYVLIAVLGLFAGISIVSMSALPVTQDAAGHYSTQLGTTYKDDPVLGIVSALHLHGAVETAARYYIGVLAATILIIATNAGLIGISRLSWSLAEHRQLPGVFCRLHPRYRTPWFTIAFFSAIAIVLLIPGQTDFLGNLYSFGAMLSFTVAHVSIVALRLRDPSRDRPYRAPWNVRIRGKPVPMTAVSARSGPPPRSCRWSCCTPRPGTWGPGGWSPGWRATFSTAAARGSIPRSSTGSSAHNVRSASTRSPTTRRWCRSSAPMSVRRR